MFKLLYLSISQEILKREMEKRVNENKEEIIKFMNSTENILLERLLKRNIEIQRNNENKENHFVTAKSPMGNILSKLESTHIESKNHNLEFLMQYIHHQGLK